MTIESMLTFLRVSPNSQILGELPQIQSGQGKEVGLVVYPGWRRSASTGPQKYLDSKTPMEWFLIETICARGEAMLNAISLLMQIRIEAEAHRGEVHAGIDHLEDDIGMKGYLSKASLILDTITEFLKAEYEGGATNTLVLALVELRSVRLLQGRLQVDRLVNGVGSGDTILTAICVMSALKIWSDKG